MSKKIQCKCCKEYWWETDIHSKSGLCPNCYDYVSDLEVKLAESERQANDWKQRFESSEERNKQMTDNSVKALELKNEKIKELQQQLAEKDKLLRQKIGKMKSTDFIRMCKECGFMVQAKENDNQTAIDELEKVRKQLDCENNYCYGDNNIVICVNKTIFNDIID